MWQKYQLVGLEPKIGCRSDRVEKSREKTMLDVNLNVLNCVNENREQ